MGIKENWKDSKIFGKIEKRISLKYRSRLKNENFTILSSNCVGGCIYHRLGQRFLSPTINLMLSSPDFVQFCFYLEKYINESLVFIDDDEKQYPVAVLGGGELPQIKIFFVHYDSQAEAEQKWYERIKRINYENLYLVLYDAELTTEHIKMIEQIKCNNKVVFSGEKRTDINWAKQIKPTKKHGYNYLFMDIFGLRYYEKKWDFVSFLNVKSDD